MALALDATSHNVGTSITSLTTAHTVSGSDRILVVMVAGGASDVVTGITYNGVAMTRAAFFNNGNSTSWIYYLIAPALGTNDIVVSRSPSGTIVMNAISLTGASAAQPDASGTATFSATNAAASTLTSVTNNAIHIAGFAVDAFAISSFVGGTAIGTIGVDAVSAYSPLITPAGSHTITANAGGNNAWAVTGIIITPGSQTTTSTSSSTTTTSTSTSSSTTTTSTSSSTSSSTTTTSTSSSTSSSTTTTSTSSSTSSSTTTTSTSSSTSITTSTTHTTSSTSTTTSSSTSSSTTITTTSTSLTTSTTTTHTSSSTTTTSTSSSTTTTTTSTSTSTSSSSSTTMTSTTITSDLIFMLTNIEQEHMEESFEGNTPDL